MQFSLVAVPDSSLSRVRGITKRFSRSWALSQSSEETTLGFFALRTLPSCLLFRSLLSSPSPTSFPSSHIRTNPTVVHQRLSTSFLAAGTDPVVLVSRGRTNVARRSSHRKSRSVSGQITDPTPLSPPSHIFPTPLFLPFQPVIH